jgi:sporulation protein YlmC with PRC-barrel domain
MTNPASRLLVIALVMACSSYARSQEPPNPGAAATPGSTNPSQSDPSTTTPGLVSPSPAQAGQMSGADRSPLRTLSAGTIVQTPSGQSIGTVKDVVPDSSTGQPRYILIATRSGTNTAIPYATVSSRIVNGRIILDRARLDGAPRVSDRQLRDPSDKAWQERAQKYWSADDPK